jgi:hypothetical protein
MAPAPWEYTRRPGCSAVHVKGLLFATAVATVLFASTASRAETWQAPFGGKALFLGEGRLACPGTAGNWAIEQDGHAVRPPAADDAVGRAVELKVAANGGSCATPATTLTLVTTGRWPAVDGGASTLFVDDARVELRGHGLRGAIVRWQNGPREGEDRCVTPLTDPSGEKCSVAVGRGLPADPTASDLRWMPAGARAGADVVTFDASGRRVGADDTLIHPGRVVVTALVPAEVAIDLAGGTASRIPLVHPEAVAGADCGAASCAVSGSVVVVGGVSSVSSGVSLRLRLAPRVVLQRGETFDASPVVQVPVLPCAMSVASGDALRGVDGSRLVVRVDARCAGEAKALRWFSAGRALDVLGTVDAGGAAYLLLGIGRVEGDEAVVTASRNDGSIVGQARAHTRPLPAPHATLALDGDDVIDFVPTNRPASIRWAKAQGVGELVPLPIDGVYEMTAHDAATEVQGQRGAGGFVALQFAWRVSSLPGVFATTNLAVVIDPVERPMHEATIAVALGARGPAGPPIIELLCGSGANLHKIAAAVEEHVAFEERDACRVVFHRERLTPADGAQHLQLDVDVTRVDGEARPEAHVSQPIVLRVGDTPREAWIKGILRQFDRVTVRVTHTDDTPAASKGREEPALQWAMIFGTGHFRLYGTTAIPTGMFRFSDRAHSGILSLNLGGLMRATWLDTHGQEGFLMLEAGVMAVGLPNDVSQTANAQGTNDSLTAVSAVSGLALSVPIANRSLATETSINLHAWFEYEVSRGVSGEPGSPFGFVFGPSISIGNVGTNL